MTTDKFFIYDNVLSDDDFKIISSEIIDNKNFSWSFVENVSGIKVEKNCYFVHMFYNYDKDNVVSISEKFYLIKPILNILNCKALIRVKANLYPRTEVLHHNINHRDYGFQHNAAIFYLNTNNGYTVLDDEHMIESVENRLLVFDPTVIHHSTNCTDKQFRVNINFNYF